VCGVSPGDMLRLSSWLLFTRKMWCTLHANTILLCCLQDTEQLIAAGANDLEVAQRWEQQTQVRLVSLPSSV
jgi:hypothetical protein